MATRGLPRALGRTRRFTHSSFQWQSFADVANGRPRRSLNKHPLLSKPKGTREGPRRGYDAGNSEESIRNRVPITIGEKQHAFSPVLLRDLCDCPRCIDQSTRQKLFSTVDIPLDIQAREEPNDDAQNFRLKWSSDVPGFSAEHITTISRETLRQLTETGSPISSIDLPRKVLWNSQEFRTRVSDIAYEAYMTDEATLHQALLHLHTYGLMFLTNVPESETSVSSIVERIGPLKNTFYGSTWDVRSVPQAKNVAYTSQDLGFHMDLLYMEQPPHLQFLHCIRSSTAGGASLFTDSFKAVSDLLNHDTNAFNALWKLPVNFHYKHPDAQYYFQSRRVIEMQTPLIIGGFRFQTAHALKAHPTARGRLAEDINIGDWLQAVSFAPPFQAPFTSRSITSPEKAAKITLDTELTNVSQAVQSWHTSARKFNKLLHRPEGIYERMMKPGECVIFDNRRVLHARKAFEVGDAGTERWLRGAYMDKDPYMSKMRVLQQRFGTD